MDLCQLLAQVGVSYWCCGEPCSLLTRGLQEEGWLVPFPVPTIFTVLLTENSHIPWSSTWPPFRSAHRGTMLCKSVQTLLPWLWGKHTHSSLTEEEIEEQRSQRIPECVAESGTEHRQGDPKTQSHDTMPPLYKSLIAFDWPNYVFT